LLHQSRQGRTAPRETHAPSSDSPQIAAQLRFMQQQIEALGQALRGQADPHGTTK
jgi:hypothetical protein